MRFHAQLAPREDNAAHYQEKQKTMDDIGITILNVDGSEISLYAKSRILREAGYRTIEARTGAEALRLAQLESPQLVLLSADLPDWSGFEALGKIKQEATLSSQSAPPLVLLVSATFVGCENRARALEEGADGYLLEPASPEFLLANIRMLLRRLPSAVEIARSLADEWRRGLALDGGAGFALVINSVESIEEILQIAAREARELIGAHQAMASLNPDAFGSYDAPAGAGRPEGLCAVSLSRKYAQEPVTMSHWQCEKWFSSLVCRLNRPMRLTQAELEPELDSWPHESGKTYADCGAHETFHYAQELGEIMTPREMATLRHLASLREIASLREVATPREIAGLRESAAMRNAQMMRGLDMRGWLAAPLTSRSGVYGRNLGLIQLSEKHNGEFTEQDEVALAQLACMVSIAVENRLRWRNEQKLREAAERAARAKDEYMATTSYKLRAQLNTLLGWSWVLRRQAENMEDVTRAAEIIERAARTQARLLEDLLGASRKGPAIWREVGTQGRRNGGNLEWVEEESEVWREGKAEGQWGRKVEEWREGETLDFSVVPPFHRSVAPLLRSSVPRSSNSASRGLAAGGGC
jgi:DNA-binding response OmpR family regulator